MVQKNRDTNRTGLMAVHVVPFGDDSHWNVCPDPMEFPARSSLTVTPIQMPEGGSTIVVPETGGAVQGGIVNSYAPMSGVVVLLADVRISSSTPTGVPKLSIAVISGV
jgi:hypothetical protein